MTSTYNQLFGVFLISKNFSIFSGVEILREYLLFPGCAATSLVPHLADMWLRLLRRLLDKVDIYEVCCGLPLLLMGDVDGAAEWFDENLRQILEGKIVITGCPSCYRMLKQHIVEKLGENPKYEVKHIVEVIHEKIISKNIGLHSRAKLKVTYHDPCELSRHMGITELPRETIRKISGISYVEMDQNRERATCCGGGGLMRLLYPRVSQEIAITKIRREILPLNVDAIVTACPFCEYTLAEAIKSLNLEGKLRVFDIAELILYVLGEDNGH